MSFYTRLYDFMAGATVRSQEFDDEFNAIAAASRTTIRAVDEVATDLPNAAARANRLMSFDASGQPQASNSVPDPVADMDVANRRWVQTLALTGVISVGPGDAGKIMSNDGSGIQWTAKDNLFPSMAGKAGYALLTDGSARYWGKVVWMVAYDNRADLRTATGVLLYSLALVDGLGVFQHMAGADEGPDDDETAFQTATGYWLLVCPSWDVVEAYTLLAEDYQEARIDSVDTRLTAAESFTSKMFRATSAQSAFSVALNSSTTFTVTVTGAVVGASVIATPPSAPTLNEVTVSAWVSAANTVTVYIGNGSSTNSGGFGAGDWQITVINK
jgi:hypothetical protein